MDAAIGGYTVEQRHAFEQRRRDQVGCARAAGRQHTAHTGCCVLFLCFLPALWSYPRAASGPRAAPPLRASTPLHPLVSKVTAPGCALCAATAGQPSMPPFSLTVFFSLSLSISQLAAWRELDAKSPKVDLSKPRKHLIHFHPGTELLAAAGTGDKNDVLNLIRCACLAARAILPLR